MTGDLADVLIGGLSGIFMAALGVLALYGFMGWVTLYLYVTVRHRVQEPPSATERRREDLPAVTVQIPVFNERLVVRRVIEAACGLDYPSDRLQIQILDDSTDDTTTSIEDLVARYRARGWRIDLVHRSHRAGFKAGALERALDTATGEFIAIFDADFQPGPDFLLRTTSCFDSDPRLGLVQTRWAHLNRGTSWLTAAQAISIDRHFAIEQTVRYGAGYFPKFNGSAGVWRRACIEDAGGWRADTLCEDLCLSTRAFLRGWRFRLLPQVTAPAEIPDSISAFKTQQARWAQGSLQCLTKYGRAILGARDQPLAGRLYALLVMSGYVTAMMAVLLLLSLVPLVALGWSPPVWLSLLALAAASQPVLYAASQQALYARWWRHTAHLFGLLVLGLGTAPSVARGAFNGAVGKTSPFVRTVKGHLGWQVYPHALDGLLLVELFLASYATAGLVACALRGTLRPIPFFAACLAGFGYVGLKSRQEQRARVHAEPASVAGNDRQSRAAGRPVHRWPELLTSARRPATGRDAGLPEPGTTTIPRPDDVPPQ